MKKASWLCCLVLAALPLSAQDYVGIDDFLTDHEEDLIRVAQDPNERILQYLEFARLRLELVRQQLASDKPGRSQGVHRNLEQYGDIVDAIDMVIDDALVRKLAVDKGILALTEQGKQFLAALRKIVDNPAKDQWAYEFVLKDAIDITEDTIELAQGDLGARKQEIEEADVQEDQQRLESMTPQQREEVTETREEERKEAEERQRRRPTLRKPGETNENSR